METDEPIFAAADGSVTEIFDRWPNSCGSRGCSYGNYVWIDHDNGYATFYAHLQSVDDSIIAPLPITVTQGITIGIMGGTGGILFICISDYIMMLMEMIIGKKPIVVTLKQ